MLIKFALKRDVANMWSGFIHRSKLTADQKRSRERERERVGKIYIYI